MWYWGREGSIVPGVGSGVSVGAVNVTVEGTTVSVGTGVSVCISSVDVLWIAAGETELLQAANRIKKTERVIKRFIATNLIS